MEEGHFLSTFHPHPHIVLQMYKSQEKKLQFVGESSNECKESVTKKVVIMTTPITYTKKL